MLFFQKCSSLGCSSSQLDFYGGGAFWLYSRTLTLDSFSLERWIFPIRVSCLLFPTCEIVLQVLCLAGCCEVLRGWGQAERKWYWIPFSSPQNQWLLKQRRSGKIMELWLWLCGGQAVSSVERWVHLRICSEEGIVARGDRGISSQDQQWPIMLFTLGLFCFVFCLILCFCSFNSSPYPRVSNIFDFSWAFQGLSLL